MNKRLSTFLLSILITWIITKFPNKSNFPDRIIIPTMCAIIIKYTFGDWDKGYNWTSTDIEYWATIFGTSYLTTYLIT
tara:strand:+ start:8403 stop:8636 length:234 start_codon:yes stop_codon:yes gene_type:complete